MKVILIFSLLVVVISASFLEEKKVQFHSFKLEHSKTYINQAEEDKRFHIFNENLREIEEHNARYEQGEVSYKKGINRFADMTHEEFNAMLTLKASKPTVQTTSYVKRGLEIPSSIDWRETGQVTEVKDQANCASCWAFAVTGSLEAAYYRKSGKLVPLSEQQLVDCTIGINYGCLGGQLDRTFRYIRQAGLQSESSYPYQGYDLKCNFSASDVVTKITNFTAIEQGDENALLDAVANVGPVAVAIDASFVSLYESGIYEDYRCSPYDLDHAVLIVGYGTEDGKDYWIMKNSWGAQWGDNGYFKLVRGKNECGVAENVVFASID